MTEMTPTPSELEDTTKVQTQVDAVIEAPLNIQEMSHSIQELTKSIETLKRRMALVESNVDMDDEGCWQCDDYESRIYELQTELEELEAEMLLHEEGELPPCGLEYLMATGKIINGRMCWCRDRQLGDRHPHSEICAKLQNIQRFEPSLAATLRRRVRP